MGVNLPKNDFHQKYQYMTGTRTSKMNLLCSIKKIAFYIYIYIIPKTFFFSKVKYFDLSSHFNTMHSTLTFFF